MKGRKTNSPRDAYFYLASVPPEMLVFIEAEMPNPSVNSKIRAYIQKWRPMRLALPFAELDALGVPRGPKFDKIIEQIFDLQLRGRARTPEDRTKALRSLAGIKEEPKKKEEKDKKKRKGSEITAGPKPADAKHQGKQAACRRPHRPQGRKIRRKRNTSRFGRRGHWSEGAGEARTRQRTRGHEAANPGQSEGAGKEIAWQVTASGE